MITIEKIKMYEYLRGDVNFLARSSKKTKSIVNEDEFYIIRNLIQDIKLVQKGLAAISYEETVKERLSKDCDNEETIKYLKSIANKF